MKKKILFFMTAVVLVMSSCAGGRQVEWTLADRYFVNNNAPKQTSLKFTSQQQFDQYFGMAAAMGKDGQPTPIDFSRQMVVAKIFPVTDVRTEVKPLGLTRLDDGRIELRYQVSIGQRQSYTTQPFLLLIVDKKYADSEFIERRIDMKL